MSASAPFQHLNANGEHRRVSLMKTLVNLNNR